MRFFDIENIFFSALGYPMSYLEFFGTLAGGVAVWLSAKNNILSWPIGIINVVLFFFLFYQVQLYPDMFLQVFFLVTNLLGWWRWAHPKIGEEDRKKELKVSLMDRRQFLFLVLIGLAGTYLFGSFAKNLHEFFPTVFSLPSAFPYADSFVTVMSIITTFLMIQKKVECWIIWIIIDAVATYLYFAKGIKFVAAEYLIFCFLASFGLWNWTKEYKSQQ
ncbi:nicotinamide riboside transporter PnuC [Chryseolinea sp. H1M3-3]|uniref:nicotinamide riboside transporter PnuC n=1 Tax=Chryseolinea sp. H1M3-3 TaxID=3034144 RepID=UPI0023ECA759|nr:nicotinamide riboside transporter PnuC [Chryseolinea sp. H1M3-3]